MNLVFILSGIVLSLVSTFTGESFLLWMVFLSMVGLLILFGEMFAVDDATDSLWFWSMEQVQLDGMLKVAVNTPSSGFLGSTAINLYENKNSTLSRTYSYLIEYVINFNLPSFSVLLLTRTWFG